MKGKVYNFMIKATLTPSGKYRTRVYCGRDESGKQIMKSFTANTRWEAEMLADEFIKNGKKTNDELTIGEAIDGYIMLKENVLSPSTIKGYKTLRRNRLQCLMCLDVHELDSLKMQRAINIDAMSVSRKSISEAKSLILTALKLYGIKPDIEVTLPAKKPKFKVLPTAEQIFNIIIGTEVELPCLLAMWLSLRMSEVRGLQFGDIQNGVLTVQRSKMYLNGKDVVRDVNKTYNSTRQLVLPQYIREKIENLPHECDSDFIIQKGYCYIKSHFDKLLEENGLKMTFHDLRHLNASVMLKLGVPDKYAMERGGWSTSSTLKSVYQHTFSDERKKVDEAIDNYFNEIVKNSIKTKKCNKLDFVDLQVN